MKTLLATALTAVITLSAASAANAESINRGSNLAFRHAGQDTTRAYALTGEQPGPVIIDRYQDTQRLHQAYHGGRNVH